MWTDERKSRGVDAEIFWSEVSRSTPWCASGGGEGSKVFRGKSHRITASNINRTRSEIERKKHTIRYLTSPRLDARILPGSSS